MSNEEAAPPPAVRRLLLDVIDTFEKLEIVVHVARRPTPQPTPLSIGSALGIAQRTVAEALSELAQSSVIVMADREAGAWSIDVDGPWANAAAALARLYDEDRVMVLDLMTRTALERVRSQAARAFADAFVLRSTKKDSDG